MPAPYGNLISLALHTVSKGIRTVWGSDSDRAGVVPFGPDFYDDTNFAQINKSAACSNATTVLHTVTVGKSLYLYSLYAFVVSNTGAFTQGNINITDSGGVTQYTFEFLPASGNHFAFTHDFTIPMKLPSQYAIKLVSVSASFHIKCTIFGFEK